MIKENKIKTTISRLSLPLVLVMVLVVFGSVSPIFLSVSNISNMLLGSMASSFLAYGAIFILVINEFDLSLGYNLTLSMCTAAFLGTNNAPDILVLIIPLLMGTIYGFLNGLIVVKYKISSFIVTLAVGLTLSGIAQIITAGGNLYLTYPQWLLYVTRKSVFNVAIMIIIWLFIGILLHYYLTQVPTGRQMYAVGNSERTAYLAGIKTSRIRILGFSLAGFFAALGGIVMVGQLGTASSAYGASLLLPAYAVVFLSKASFKIGYINVPGAIVSIAIICLGTKGLELVGVPTWSEYMFQGVALLFAMWLSTRTSPVEIK